MSDLFREVDDTLRQERVLKFWKENTPYILFFVIGTIVLTGGVSAYKSWQRRVNQEATSALIALEETPDYPDSAITALESKATLVKPDFRALASFKAAQAFLLKKEPQKALVLYEALSKDPDISEDFRAPALLMFVRLQRDSGTDSPETLLAMMAPLWKDPQNIWAPHAHLEAALIQAHALKDFKKAREHLNHIQETKDLPETLYQKAQALDHLYALKNKTNG